MYKDNGNLKRSDADVMNIGTVSSDAYSFSMTGQITDRIFNTKGELVDTIVGHNMIVNSFTYLVMAFAKQVPGYSGIQYWAIGSGEPTWDQLATVPSPNADEVKLTNEINRIRIDESDMTFLNADGSVSSKPTNIIQIKKTFGANDCNGKWREFAIFGGNATQAADSGIMINKRHHGRIDKTNEMIIERTMKFTLSLS